MKQTQPDGPADRQIFPMAPLIRFTLVALYLSLAAPLPLLAPSSSQQALLGLALALGLGLVLAVSSEQVLLDATGIQVTHPQWCAWLLRRGWQLEWRAIEGITPVATSQGGRVFYLRCGDRACLLPQRIAHFPEFLERLGRETGLETEAIGRISPPWTYQLLALICAVMLTAELTWGLLALKAGLMPL